MRDWLSGLDPVTGTFTLPVWAAGAAVILFWSPWSSRFGGPDRAEPSRLLPRLQSS